MARDNLDTSEGNEVKRIEAWPKAVVIWKRGDYVGIAMD